MSFNDMVYDYVGVLSEERLAMLQEKLIAYRDTASVEICVVIAKDLAYYSPYLYTKEILEKWEVGRNYDSRGVVILIRPKEHNKEDVTIDLTNRASSYLPVRQARRIANGYVLPLVVQKKYDEATELAVDEVIASFESEFKKETHWLVELVALFFLGSILLVVFIYPLILSYTKLKQLVCFILGVEYIDTRKWKGARNK